MKKLLAVLMVVALLAGSGTPARAVDLKDIIGVVGGGFVVDAIAGPLNDFINTITFNRGVGSDESTKVVPIVSVGSGTRIGAAQVSGPKNTVNKTKAVAQVEATFQGKIRVKILIPIDSKNPIERFRRVQGVGVSAVIDYDL
ncbi:MAG: hypothetical protein K9L28_01260 [Synergistales bacterium]|nr:hypothetical protein [Synergistales bacterium]